MAFYFFNHKLCFVYLVDYLFIYLFGRLFIYLFYEMTAHNWKFGNLELLVLLLETGRKSHRVSYQLSFYSASRRRAEDSPVPQDPLQAAGAVLALTCQGKAPHQPRRSHSCGYSPVLECFHLALRSFAIHISIFAKLGCKSAPPSGQAGQGRRGRFFASGPGFGGVFAAMWRTSG